MGKTRCEVALPSVPRAVDGMDLTMGPFKNPQGLRLATYRFAPSAGGERRTGTVLMCHGYGVHTVFEWSLPSEPGGPRDTWEGSIVAGLVRAGYVVHALDHQGFGRSEGARGLRAFFEAFDDLAAEALSYTREVVLNERGAVGRPLFLFGMSMGGATAVRMAQMAPELWRGMVLYAPMLSLERVKDQRIAGCIRNRDCIPLSRLGTTLLPTLPLLKDSARDDVGGARHAARSSDPLNWRGSTRVRVAQEFNDVCGWFMDGGLGTVATPFVTVHSVRDTFTDPAGSQELYETAVGEDRTYLRVGPGCDIGEDMWHSLSTEPGQEAVFERALAWILERSEAPAHGHVPQCRGGARENGAPRLLGGGASWQKPRASREEEDEEPR